MTGKKQLLLRVLLTGIIAALVMSGCQNPLGPKLKKTDNAANAVGNNGISPFEESNGIYRVYVQPTARGTVRIDKPSGVYAPDEMVAMTIEADEGYECSYLRAVITDAVNAPISGNLSDRTRVFRMPTANVYVYAGFVLNSRSSISIGEQVYGKIVSFSHTEAALGNIVTVAVEPDPGYELEAGGIRVIGNTTGAVVTGGRTTRRNEYSFSMISEPVTVHAFFFDSTKEQFTIQTEVARDQSGNSVVIKGMAAANETVTIAMYLKDDHILLEKPLVTFKTTSLPVTQNPIDPTKWTFTMPTAIATGETVSVRTSWRMIPMYAISAGVAETSAGEGRFIVEGLNNAGKIAPGGDVTLTLKINDAENYYYKQDSVEVLNAANTSLKQFLTLVEDNWNGATVVWKFAVPQDEPASLVETLRVSAVIDSIPAHAVTFTGLSDNGKKAGTIAIAPVATGKDIAAGELKVREGKTTTAVLSYDEDDYTLTQGSFKVSRTSGGEIQAQREGETKLTFLMHPQAVTVSAVLTAKPFIPITVKNDNTGTIRLAITSSDSKSKENARAGYTIAVLPAPAPGYTGATTPPVITPAMTSLQKGADNVWRFTMPADATTVNIQWQFTELGNIPIFKGGPSLPGLTVVQSPWNYGNNIDFVDLTENNAGRTPGTKAIRIGPNSRTAGRTYSGAEVGFGLSAPDAIDASWAGALSFWMRQESGINANPDVDWVGFGDGNRAIWYGDNNNQNITGTTTWKRYIVPVPAPRDGMKMSRVFFWKAYGNAIWLIDDIEFISAAQVELTAIAIQPTYPSQLIAGEPMDAYKVANYNSRIAFTYKTTRGDEASAIMFSASGDNAVNYNWGYWVPTRNYTYKIYGTDAELSGSEIIPITQGGNFELTLNLGQTESNKMKIEIERNDMRILENFELDAPAQNGNRYWDEMLWREGGTGNNVYGGTRSGSYKYLRDPAPIVATNPQSPAANQKDPPRAGRNFSAAMDISGFTTLSFWIKGNQASIEGDTLSFMLCNGGVGNNPGTLRAVNFTITGKPAGTNNFKRIDIPLANFAGLDQTKVTGWAFSINTKNGCTQAAAGYEYQFWLDEITVNK